MPNSVKLYLSHIKSSSYFEVFLWDGPSGMYQMLLPCGGETCLIV